MDESKPKFNLPEAEEKVLKFWEENDIFTKTLEKTKKGKKFVFYEGPPTANAAPGIHHVEARVFKDIIPRYKTMRGFFVPRKAGWDTHGLPVEIQIEKELGFKTKQDIESYGLAKFNAKAKESVWRHKQEFEDLTRRIAFWLDMEHPYVTYETSYMESLWWMIKEFWKKGLLYQDFKSVPWCPRCGTGLSSHEVGQGYQKVKELSVYVKLKIKGRKNEYLLIWTTTPWTLPANVAVAVNSKLEYAKYKIDQEFIWSALTPPYEPGRKADVVEKVSGRSLVGMEYEPLFVVPGEYSRGAKPPYRVFPADFVSLGEGTGLVHIASAFGEEDLNLMKAAFSGQDGYPILQTVDPDGTMRKGVIGEGKFVKEADALIIEDLKKRSILQKEAIYEHDYPFCWRCATPLLYYAREAWWVRTTAVKDKLLKNNEAINWIPQHFKQGRFGEFLREVRDWAFSRERYWGTTLPIWKCEKCEEIEVVGSRDELAAKIGRAKNRYFLMRHGEALTNSKDIISYTLDGKYRLTLCGRKQVTHALGRIKNKKIDLIFSSDIPRTRETAEIVGKALGLKHIFDKRLREINTGVFEERSSKEYHAFFSSRLEKFFKRPRGGENLADVRVRTLAFLKDMEKKYSGKTLLIVSHEYPLWMLTAGSLGLTNEEAMALNPGGKSKDFIEHAEVRELCYKELPRDETGEVNLHRPYVDDIAFACKKCEGEMRRIPEVADVWFDSGAMPFAQAHWPFFFEARPRKIITRPGLVRLPFPADYICEAVDQTRGWFYTLLAVSTLLSKGTPYKNVISLGHVLDKYGQKMSKSKGNVVDAWEMIKKYGADTLRWYFFTINAPADPKRFDEKDLANKLRGFLMIFWNSFVLFDTYVGKITNYKLQITNNPQPLKSKNILDQWILAKLNGLVMEVTKKLDAYDITGAGRAIEDFVVADFSQWYLRRSRRRLQHPESVKEKEEVALVIAKVLLTLCKLSAPFLPFLAEIIYQELRKKMNLKELSVHLTGWPSFAPAYVKATAGKKATDGKTSKLIDDMQTVRKIVAEALRLRAEAGIKVRQPLASLQIRNPKFEIRNRKELLELIKDEVNIKEVSFEDGFKLDTKITSELKEEGTVREFIRNIQEMRRDAGLKPGQLIKIQVSGDKALGNAVSKWKEIIKKDTYAKEIKIGGKKVFTVERDLEFDEAQLWAGIDKV